MVTNDVHYARPEGRELHDVLTAIRHGRTLDELRDLRRPDGESYLKSGAELMRLPPGSGAPAAAGARGATPGRDLWRGAVTGSGTYAPAAAARGATPGRDLWRGAVTGSALRTRTPEPRLPGRRELATPVSWLPAAHSTSNSSAIAFPGFPVPKGHTPFSHLEELCHEGARRRYHPISAPVLRQLAHELDVIERTGLAEFFLICWDLMRFARSRGIPAQGRGSAADSIVAYVLGITRVDPIRHNLLFERFINEGRTTYPDVDIDFSSERREEVIQYVYERYGAEHTGMVCNLVTYRARSAVREVGYALGFPRPLVDRVAKALETYDATTVRADLEADGSFGQFFAGVVERETDAVGPDGHVAGGGPVGGRPDGHVGGGPGGGRAGGLGRGRGRGRGRNSLNTAPGDAKCEARPETGPNEGPSGPEESVSRSVGADYERPPTIAPVLDRPGRYWERLGVSAPAAARLYGADIGGGSALEQQRRLTKRRAVESDAEGGPGDSPASIARLAAERAAAERAKAAERTGAAERAKAAERTGAAERATAADRSRSAADRMRAATTGPRRPQRPACLFGSAGWSSAPASTASRATSRSTAAACS